MPRTVTHASDLVLDGTDLQVTELVAESKSQQIRTGGGYEPDPNWRFTDAALHEHFRDGYTFPTLRWVIDRTYWCWDCGDEHEEGHYECALCGEHITPGTRPAPEFITVTGPTTIRAQVMATDRRPPDETTLTVGDTTYALRLIEVRMDSPRTITAWYDGWPEIASR